MAKDYINFEWYYTDRSPSLQREISAYARNGWDVESCQVVGQKTHVLLSRDRGLELIISYRLETLAKYVQRRVGDYYSKGSDLYDPNWKPNETDEKLRKFSEDIVKYLASNMPQGE